MRLLAAVALFVALAVMARAEELTLSVPGLPKDASATAFTGVEKPLPAVRDGDLFKWPKLSPGSWNIELKVGSTDVIGVDMRLRDIEGRVTATAPLPAEDEAAIRAFFEHTQDFFGRRRMPLLLGTADKAVALIENIQDASSTTMPEAKGKAFFRVDLWDFEKAYGSWRKVRSRTILRRTLDVSDLASTAFVYSTDLGGVDIAPGQSRRLDYSFPSSPLGDKEKK